MNGRVLGWRPATVSLPVRSNGHWLVGIHQPADAGRSPGDPYRTRFGAFLAPRSKFRAPRSLDAEK